jgi:hypothetical protein
MAVQLEGKTGKYAGNGSVIAPGRCGRVKPLDTFPRPEHCDQYSGSISMGQGVLEGKYNSKYKIGKLRKSSPPPKLGPTRSQTDFLSN